MMAPDPQQAELSHREYRAQFLLEVGSAVTSHLDLADVLEAIWEALRPRVHFDSIALLVTDGDSVRLHSLFIHDLPRSPGESVASLVARTRAKREQSRIKGGMLLEGRISDSSIQELAKDKRPYVCEDLEAGMRFPEESLFLEHGVKSYVSLPLLRRNQLIGAIDFLAQRPLRFKPEELQLLEDASAIVSIAVANALAYEEIKTLQEQLHKENQVLQDEIDQGSMYEEIVGTSPSLSRVLENVDRVAPTEATVLITGETGTGKELVARAIHRRSPRASRAMVKVNCAALPAELIASELFGHEKGAFTGALQARVGRFEAADGGTIFLDEIGELPPEMQIALLRVLQEREFERVGGNKTIHADVRVIAATNRDLKREVAEGRFREDLYYRLNVFPIECPPLRERQDDIPLLVEYFTSRFGGRMGKRVDHIDSRAFECLMRYNWPGNIRELQNVIERAVILADGRTLRLQPGMLDNPPARERNHFAASAESPSQERERRRAEIENALRKTGGRVSGAKGAAALLGVPPSTLESRIRNLGINKHAFRWQSGAA